MSSNAASSQPCDILITNAHVLTLDAARNVYPVGAVAISGNRIAAVGPEREVAATVKAKRVIDAGGGVVHPGFIEPHNHVNMQCLRSGLTNLRAQPDIKIAHADLRASLSAEEERLGALLSCIEMIRLGFTGFVEPGTYFDTDGFADACRTIGMRGWITAPYAWDQAGSVTAIGLSSQALLDRVPPTLDRSERDLRRELKRNADRDGIVQAFIGIYGEGTASDELLALARKLAEENDVMLQIHSNYVASSTDITRQRVGRAPIAHFAKIGFLPGRCAIVHANVLEDEEVEIMAGAAGLSIVWVPANYLKNGIMRQRLPRIPELARRGVNVTIGTDISMDWSLGDGMLLAHLTARGMGETLTPENLIEMQTVNAARMLHCQDRLGSIEPGKLADVVVRGTDGPGWNPRVNPLHELALLARATPPASVIVNGVEVFAKGAFTRIDEAKVYAEAAIAGRRILDRFGLAVRSTWPSR